MKKKKRERKKERKKNERKKRNKKRKKCECNVKNFGRFFFGSDVLTFKSCVLSRPFELF